MNLHEEPVSLVHFDCDLYESTAYVFANIEARIEVGCVLIFDEFYGYPSWKIHEYRAFMEHMSRTNYVYEMVGRSNDMQRFMFRRTA